MLTISKPLSAGQAQSYHKKEFASKEQSYWARGSEIQGEWRGRLAEKYGLSGAVAAEDFARLSQGQHPVTGKQLVRHRTTQHATDDGRNINTAEHRAGWDATFSAPKSVSLTALVGGDQRVREAHRESVWIALDQLERYTQARIGGNHPAETTGKFAVATFEHDTARPVDGYAAPQLHTHAVIFNVTSLENGETRALQPHSLFASQQFATAVYQAELTYRLVKLGYELERGRSGAPEIKGYTQEYLDASSPRSQQIRAHLERLGLSSKESAEIAAHSTRDQKRILSPAEVLTAHRQLAAQFGNQADRIVAEARERSRTMEQPLHGQAETRAREAVTFSRDRNFEREAVVDERLLMRDALRRAMGKATYADVRQNFEIRVDNGDFLVAHQPGRGSTRFFTTPETIAFERSVIATMRAGQNQLSPILSHREVIEVTAGQPHLNSSQRTAIEKVLTSPDRVQGIQGIAGAGKTTALSVIRAAAEARGHRVEGFAPTSRAAKQLRDAGISAGTLQGFLARGQSSQSAKTDSHLYFVDESSLASTKQMKDFLARLGPWDRVALIGDTRQHQAVEAGKPFEQLQDAGMSTAQLDEIIRQKDPGLKLVVEHLSRGQTSPAISALREQGRITEIRDSEMRMKAIATEYASSPSNTLVVSPDNTSRRQLNDAIRTELQSKGAVSNENHAFKVLVQQQDMTGADRRWAARYAVGDQLRYSRGSSALGISAGSYAQVTSTDLQQNQLTVRTANGGAITYDPRRLAGVSIYRETEQQFAVGDRIQFTAPDKTLGVANRELANIKEITRSGNLRINLDDGRELTLNPTANRHFDHGYAVTSHSAQGLTAERVLLNVDTNMSWDLVNSRFAYVAVSRGRTDVQIFTSDRESLDNILGSNGSKTSVLTSAHLSAETSSLSSSLAQ